MNFLLKSFDELYKSSETRGTEEDTEMESSGISPEILASLKEITSTKSKLDASVLEDEETEVWLLQCPANVNLENLLIKKKIRLEGTTVLEEDSKQYEIIGIPQDGAWRKEDVVTLIPDEYQRLKLTPARGHLLVRESLPELTVPKLIANPKTFHSLPVGIKERHPVYGTDIDQMIKDIEVSHAEAKKSRRKKSHKSKKHKDDAEIDTSILTPTPDITPETTAHGLKKKSKKSKHREPEPPRHADTAINGYVDNVNEVPTPHKSKKRKSHHKDGINGYAPNENCNGTAETFDVDAVVIKIEPGEDETPKKRKSRKHHH